MEDKDSNKRVAKNAIALTIRMVIATVVGLYTSRIVVEALGLADYGIYGVIGGVVGMASFLNSSMAGATSRFITFAIGKGDIKEARQVFSSALLIHIGIAIFVAILAETVGLWFVNNKMNFPRDSMFSVNVLYQFTIISMMLGFTQVPYSADIVAREKMNIYAYFELINIFLKLAIVYVLFLFESNRLIWYASMTLGVSIISMVFYRLYCVHNFEEAHFTKNIDRKVTKDMLSFSGYDLYGNMCVIARNQGQPIILNLFFGVVANAAASLATTINGTLLGLSGNISVAFKPQIVKSYATGDYDRMVSLMRRSLVFTMMIFGILCIPFFIEPANIVNLWLGKVPKYIVPILRIIMVVSIIDSVVRLNNTAIHSTGDIKRISFINGTFYLLSPIFSYIILKIGLLNVRVIYLSNVIMLTVVLLSGWKILKMQIPQANWLPLINACMKSIFVLVLSILFTYFIGSKIFWCCTHGVANQLIRIITNSLLGFAIITTLMYFLVLNQSERIFLWNKSRHLYNKIFN